MREAFNSPLPCRWNGRLAGLDPLEGGCLLPAPTLLHGLSPSVARL